MNILLVDNYDSFTFNLYHLIRSADRRASITLVKNDCLDTAVISNHDRIVISPGPGIPDEAGDIKEMIALWASEKPVLGICLGHQAIAEVFGAGLSAMSRPLHGQQSNIRIKNHQKLFQAVPNTIKVTHYHSWRVNRESMPDCLNIDAIDDDNEIMAVSHKQYPVFGLQFHPESFCTEYGVKIIKNFLTVC